MRGLTKTQQIVYDRALARLRVEPWFKNVCMNNFPNDIEIILHGIDEAVSEVYYETAYRDEPL